MEDKGQFRLVFWIEAAHTNRSTVLADNAAPSPEHRLKLELPKRDVEKSEFCKGPIAPRQQDRYMKELPVSLEFR